LKSDDPNPVRAVCGYAAADAPATADEWTLHVWLRGAYRNQGVGSRAVQSLEEYYRRTNRGGGRLRILLPTRENLSPGDRAREVLWLSLFGNLDFRRGPARP